MWMIRLKTKVLWRMIPHCLMWVVWRERNTYTSEGNERSIHELKLLFFSDFAQLCKCFGHFYLHFFTWYAWFMYFLCCLWHIACVLFSSLFSNIFFDEVYYLSNICVCVRAHAIPISLLRIHSWFHSFGIKALFL